MAEQRGMAALRGGRREVAAAHLREALALAEESASVGAGRIRRILAALTEALAGTRRGW